MSLGMGHINTSQKRGNEVKNENGSTRRRCVDTSPRRNVWDWVLLLLGSANRDERRWERSEEFDIFRTRTPHISFAAGEHTCMGLHLARMETRVAVECLLTRLDDIRLTTDNDPHIHGQPFRSPTALPVTFRPTSAQPAE